MDAGAELGGGVADLLQRVVEMHVELRDRVGPAVGEARLGQAPDAFIGIELGSVWGERHQMQASAAAAQLSNGDPTVDGGVVPDDDDVAAQMPEQVPQERTHPVAVDVVAMEPVIEPHAAPHRADRDPADDRDPVATVAVPHHRRVPARCPGLEQRRDQLEAALVREDEVGPQPRGVFFTAGQVLRFHRSMAASSRSSARRSGCWQLQPSRLITRPT